MEERFPTVLDVLSLHNFVMDRTGTPSQGLLEDGEEKLDSAIIRPYMAMHYEGADLPRQAALLISGIATAHAFVDGNKRTALITADTYLRRNGAQLKIARLLELAKQIELLLIHSQRGLSIAQAEDELTTWLANNIP